MKKIIKFLILFICVSTYAQTYTHGGGVKIQRVPTGESTDEVIAIKPSGLIVKSGVAVSSLNQGGNIDEFVSIKSLGGQGDDIADDKPFFDLAEAQEESIRITEGVYRINSNLTLTKNYIFQGGIIKPANGVVITVESHIQDFPIQMFDLSLGGSLDFTNTNTTILNPFQIGVREQEVNDTVLLQTYFNLISSYNLIGDFRGSWEVDDTISITGTDKTFMCGSFRSFNDASIEPLIDIATRNGKYIGELNATANTSASYSLKNQVTGVDFTNSLSRNTFDKISVQGFKGYGVKVLPTAGSAIMDKIDFIQLTSCGSTGSAYTTGSYTTNVTSIVNNGSANSTGQTSVLTVDSVDQTVIVEDELLEINGKVHLVRSTTATSITVYPWVDNTFTGAIYGLHGGLLIAGANTASFEIGRIDAIRAGSIRTGGLYGSRIGVVQTQACGIGYAIGYEENGNNLGSVLDHLYVENNTFDLAQITRVDTNSRVGYVTPSFGNVAIIDAQSAIFEPSGNNQLRAIIYQNSQVYTQKRTERSKNGNSNSSTLTISNDIERNKVVILKDAPTFILKWEEDINNIFGKDYIEILITGTGTNNEPTGTITFNLDSGDQTGGITVMGGTTYTITGAALALRLFASFDYSNQNWIISNLTESEVITQRIGKTYGGFTTYQTPNPYTLTEANLLADELAGTIIKLNDDISIAEEVPTPTGFSFDISTVGLDIYRSGNSNQNKPFITNIDELQEFRDLFMVTSSPHVVMYMSPTGSDANDGLTEATAKATLASCITGSANTVYIKGGVYAKSKLGMNGAGNRPDIDMNIIGYDGDVYGGALQEDGLVFTVHDAATNVYTANIGVDDLWVLDLKSPILSKNKVHKEYKLVSSIANVLINPGSYYYDGADLYIRTISGESPVVNQDIAIVRSGATEFIQPIQNDNTLYTENITLYGAITKASNITGSTASLRMRDCKIAYGRKNQNLLSIYGGDFHIVSNVIASFTGDDIYNWHFQNSNSEVPNIIEHNNEGYYNGYDSGNNQISTAHDGISIVRINSYYEGSLEELVSDVGAGTESWNLGVRCLGGFNNGGLIQGMVFTDAGNYWLDKCTISSTGNSSLRISTGATVNILDPNFSIFNINNTGGTVSYYGYN